MKPRVPARTLMALLCVLPTLLVAGCPIPMDDGTSPNVSGTYWIEYEKNKLVLFELPAYRNDPNAMWYAMETARPSWYSGPGIYEKPQEGVWQRVNEEDGTLDDFLTTDDPRPLPEISEEPELAVEAQPVESYWVEYADGTLVLVPLPDERGEETAPEEYLTDPPAWYVGPGVYDLSAGLEWDRVISGDEMTLDEVLVLWDTKPSRSGAGEDVEE